LTVRSHAHDEHIGTVIELSQKARLGVRPPQRRGGGAVHRVDKRPVPTNRDCGETVVTCVDTTTCEVDRHGEQYGHVLEPSFMVGWTSIVRGSSKWRSRISFFGRFFPAYRAWHSVHRFMLFLAWVTGTPQ
jgi:hypothetical protein